MIDVTGASQILSMVSDNRLYAERMDELRKTSAQADAKMAEAKALQDKYVLADSMINKATAMIADTQKKIAELVARELAVKQRETALDEQERDSNQRAEKRLRDLVAREQAVASRENDVKAQRSKLDYWETDFNARKTALDRRETRMKDIAKAFLGE